MKKDNHVHILFRYGVITMLILLFSGMIGYKLFSTTVIDATHWNEKARRQLEKVDTILPERGDILSDKGELLATNLRYYTVRIDFRCDNFKQNQYLASIDALADSMGKHFPIRTRDEWRKRLEKPLKTEKAKRPRAWPLVGNISFLDLQKIKSFPFFNIGNPNKTGMTVESVLRRSNPYGAMARRSVGGVGQTRECKEVHGIYGLEKALDSLLYGKPGLSKKIALTKDIVNWTDVPPTPGYNVRTTIDIQLQDIVENELNRVLDSCSADWGCAVLMDVKTGDIKAISNLERSKNGNGYIEALNYAVVGFEPGSVVKPISMMIALEDGLVDNLEEVIPIGQSWAYAGGRPITDSHYNGSLRVREVIEQSSNIGMARIITRGYDKNPKGFVERLRSIGFLEPMHTGIAGETTPYFNPEPARIDLSRMCYGYASQIPPIYTLSIYNAIANDGKYVRPRLVSRLTSETTDTVLPVSYIGSGTACSPKNASLLRMMLTNVVWGEHGTGKLLRNDKVRIAGKTGTCYIIENRGYNTSKKRLAFCGFFPADNPKYSCIVLTCHPRQNAFGAASTSGTVLKNIALKMYSRGMLDNNPELRPDPEQPQQPPVMFASTHQRVDYLRQGFNIGHVKHFAPAKASRTVPSLKGCSLRDAINHMESLGIDVTFSGSGYVTSQSIPPGTTPAAGARIHLTLNN